MLQCFTGFLMGYLFTRRKQRVDELKCNNCKYKTNVSNTEETGTAICSYPQGEWFVVNVEDSCHYIPKKRSLPVEIVQD